MKQYFFFSLTTIPVDGNADSSIALMIVMHISDVPVKTVLTLDLVRAHRARKLRFDSALVSLVLDEGAPARVAAATARTNVRLFLNQCG